MEVNELLGEVYCCYHKQEPSKSQLCLTSQLLGAQENNIYFLESLLAAQIILKHVH